METLAIARRSLRHYGKRIGKIGRGALGTVYKYSKSDSSTYAVKKVPYEVYRGDKYIPTGLIREMSVLIYLGKGYQHPNIIRLLDIIVRKKAFYLILPLADATLVDLLPRLHPNQVRNYAYQIVCGVDYCLSRSIWNRDLKPDNVLYFEKEDRLVLTDFGLARHVNMADPNTKYTNEVYSLWYRAPEILMGDIYTEKAEVWALGCIIAEMYLRHPLFAERSEADQLGTIFSIMGTPDAETWPHLYELPGCPQDLPSWDSVFYRYQYRFGYDEMAYDLLSKMLRINPRERISVEEVLQHSYFKEFPSVLYSRKTQLDQLFEVEHYPLLTFEEKTLLTPGYFETRADYLTRILNFLRQHEKDIRNYFVIAYLYDVVAPYIKQTSGGEQLSNEAQLSLMDISQSIVDSNLMTYSELRRFHQTETQINTDEIFETNLLLLRLVNYDLNMATSYDFFCCYCQEVSCSEMRQKALERLIEVTKTPLVACVKPSDLARACLECSEISDVEERYSSNFRTVFDSSIHLSSQSPIG